MLTKVTLMYIWEVSFFLLTLINTFLKLARCFYFTLLLILNWHQPNSFKFGLYFHFNFGRHKADTVKNVSFSDAEQTTSADRPLPNEKGKSMGKATHHTTSARPRMFLQQSVGGNSLLMLTWCQHFKTALYLDQRQPGCLKGNGGKVYGGMWKWSVNTSHDTMLSPDNANRLK